MFFVLALLGCTPVTIKLDGADTAGTADNGGDTSADSGGDTSGGNNGGGSNGGGNNGGNGGDTGSGNNGGGNNGGGNNGGDTGNGGGNGGDTAPPVDAACSDWLPLNVEGATWTYDSSGGGSITVTGAGHARYNGVDVSVLRIDTGDGAPLLQYYTCTDEGLAIVGLVAGKKYLTDDAAAASSYAITWDPPALFTPAAMSIGDDWSTSTTLTIEQGGSTQSGRITTAGHCARGGSVTVPAGTFDTVSVTLDIGLGSTMSQSLSEGVGEVQGSIGQLVSYSLP